MHSFGPVAGTKTGRAVKVIADGDYSKSKTWGITLAPLLLVRNNTAAPITLVDDTVVPVGAAYFRFGQILVRCTAGASVGLWAAFDPAGAANGQDVLIRGQCGILDETWFDGPGMLGFTQGFQHPPVVYGGKAWKQRLLITTGAASLAAGPTVAAFETAFPEINYAY